MKIFAHEIDAAPFHRLGLGDPFTISALGGRNIGEACHMYDVFRSLTGAPAVSVSADAVDPGTLRQCIFWWRTGVKFWASHENCHWRPTNCNIHDQPIGSPRSSLYYPHP